LVSKYPGFSAGKLGGNRGLQLQRSNPDTGDFVAVWLEHGGTIIDSALDFGGMP
jgi:hypothetical protein